MWLLKLTLILCVLLMLQQTGARAPNRDEIQNYTHQVVQPRTKKSGRASKQEYDHYLQTRRSVLIFEESKTLGADLVLSDDELKANEILMQVKAAEYEQGFLSPREFAPSKHLFEVLDKINKSKLFSIISDMPKGAVLHTHSTAMGTTDFLIDLTRRDHLWACTASKDLNIIGFEFSKEKPGEKLKTSCTWTSMADLYKSNGKDKVEQYVRQRFSLHPKKEYEDNNEVWRDFEGIFDLLGGLMHYAPARKDYFRNALEEFHKDNVQYVEIRSSLSVLYDLEGTDYKAEDTIRMYEETIKEFRKTNPSFLGCKLIISPYRGKNDKKLGEYIKTFYELKEKFPNFIAGFDLVGQEEKGRPLKDMIPILLDMQQKGVNFYFHAGETNWFGSTVDENLIDAVLLGTKRIGHGYALIKHPLVLQGLKDNNIAVELNPLSNQLLLLVKDLRNHPGAYLFSDNYPVVVASDDPSFWKSTPLSHDFYVAFLGIASAHADLRFLKKLAMNSIHYSAMTEKDKHDALLSWHSKWVEFIKNLLQKK